MINTNFEHMKIKIWDVEVQLHTFMPQLFYPQQPKLRYPLDGKLGGHKSLRGYYGEAENLLPLP
jgi:hypothetical protein